MVNIPHPPPCTYSLSGHCTWMKAYAQLRGDLINPALQKVQVASLAHSVAIRDNYIAEMLDIPLSEVHARIKTYISHLGVGAGTKDAQDEASK